MINNTVLLEIVSKIDPSIDLTNVNIIQCLREEDDEPYDVWKLETHYKSYILKKAKCFELEAYTKFLCGNYDFSPEFYGYTKHDSDHYILIEYVDGTSLVNCERKNLKLALDSLIKMQSIFWQNEELSNYCQSFQQGYTSCENRGKYLLDAELESVYAEFLKLYAKLPRTLCHDDLLPFNFIVSDERAVMIDWEICGILPYPLSLARLIAHGASDGSSMFYLSEEDREFAIEYYYNEFISKKGIPESEYHRAIEYFLYYEYCEWVFVGNKYNAVDGEYYKRYIVIAKSAAETLLSKLK